MESVKSFFIRPLSTRLIKSISVSYSFCLYLDYSYIHALHPYLTDWKMGRFYSRD